MLHYDNQTSFLEKIQAQLIEQQTQIAFLQEKIAKLENVALSKQSASLGVISSKVTTRRRLIKGLGVSMLGLVASGVATNSKPVLAGNEKDNPTLNATGGNLVIGDLNLQTNPTDITRLVNESGTTLANVLFRSDNYTFGSLILSDTKIAIAGTVSGPDDNPKTRVGVYGGVDSLTVGFGVVGSAQGAQSAGLYGTNPEGAALLGVCRYGARLIGSIAPLILGTSIPPVDSGPPTSGEHILGEFYQGRGGTLYYCVTDGTPGTWRKLAGPDSAGVLHYLAKSDRFVDTRNGFGGVSGPLSDGTYLFRITGLGGRDGEVIPNGAFGIVGNTTAVVPSQSGFYKVVPGGTPSSLGTSTVNYNAQTTTANAFNCRLDANGRVNVHVFSTNNVFPGRPNILIDVVGYYI